MVRGCTRLFLFISLFFLGFFSISSNAQTIDTAEISDEELRAAYLASVLRYVTWPKEAQRQELIIGVMDADAVYQALKTAPLLQVRHLNIQVRSVQRSTQITDLDVLYVGSRSLSQLASIATLARNNHILVITEGASGREEVMINLVSSRQNRLAFQVNSDRIAEAGMVPSNELLMLRGVELEMTVAYRRKQQELQRTLNTISTLEDELSVSQQRQMQLAERITMLEYAIEERDSVLRAQAGSLEDKQLVMDSQQTTLNRLLRELDEQRLRLFSREEQLAHIQQSLQASQLALEAQQQELDNKEQQLQDKQQESDLLAERIALNRTTLATQQQVLRDQRQAIAEQLALLESREQTINRQRDLLIYVGIGLFVALFFAILSILLYYNKRKTAAQLLQTLDELEDAQDKLVESEKMAALGNLVAGVAHEVNTPLGVALTATTMLDDRRDLLLQAVQEQRLTKEQLENFLAKAAESLQLTERNLERVARLISNFKQVAVDQMITEQREIELHQYLDEIMSTLSIELRRVGISYQIEGDEGITLVTIPGAMAQIITNLTTNAIRHAFQGTEGMITIQTRRLANNQVSIRFCDNGTGMDDSTLNQLFNPFFTTKRSSGGTGLGMPIVYNLVRQKLQGDISVSSRLGKGTCFTLTMPRISQQLENNH